MIIQCLWRDIILQTEETLPDDDNDGDSDGDDDNDDGDVCFERPKNVYHDRSDLYEKRARCTWFAGYIE